MKYWLLKTEPGTYSWQDLARDKETTWDGVRNYQARNNLLAMSQGDRVLLYHSGADKCIVGLAIVTQEAFPDPTDKQWIAVKIKAQEPCHKTISLATIKADTKLTQMVLVKNARLSVQPVTHTEYEWIKKLSM